MYKFTSRVRYSETDSKGRLSLVGLLDYFQDCSTFHSEDLGVGVGYLTERHLCWVMSAWQIVVDRYPILCENIIVGTAPYEFKGVLGYRNFILETENGERLACANTVWTLVDMHSMRPVRATEHLKEVYVLEERIPMDYAPRKINILNAEGEIRESVEVRSHHLDTNYHVNNGQYIRIAMEFLPENFEIRQMRAEYKQQALLGDRIVPVIIKGDAGIITVALNRSEGEPYCIVEFTPVQCRE